MANPNDLWRNVIAKSTHDFQTSVVARGLPDLDLTVESRVLSLASFFQKQPEKFFDHPAYLRFRQLLHDISSRHESAVASYLATEEAAISRAFFFLHDVNSRDWHDVIHSDGEFQELRFVDQELHPAYLRLLEAVFFPFVHLAAFFSRIDRSKATDGLDIYNAVEEVSKSLPEAKSCYKNTMRNGIAHGGITFGLSEVEYKDKKGNTLTLSVREAVRAFDDLLDVTNGFALALASFLLTQSTARFHIPQEILLNELRAETLSPWWSIDGCVVTRISAGSQLVIYARPKTRDFEKARFYGFLTAVRSEELAPGYGRYFLSLRSPEAPPGFAAFDGVRLRQVREAGPTSFADYSGVLEDNLFFFVPRPRLPRLLGRLDSLRHSLALHWPIAIADFRRQLGIPRVVVRAAKSHRNGGWAVLNASVVLEATAGELSTATVHKACRRIVRRAFRDARRSHPWWSLVRWLPLGWARIAVFRKDYRVRRLTSFGLGADLVCTVQLQRLARIRAPDILGSQIEQRGRFRIAWNRAWLKSAV